jgi:DNA (cytosine-5)-methyltransferase 1
VVRGAAGGKAVSSRFIEWHMGLPEGWVTDVQGVGRVAAIEALGNGVVPHQAVAALVELLAAVPVEFAAA